MKSHNYLPFRASLLLSAVGLLSFAMATLAQSAWPLPVPALPNINANNIVNITDTNFGAVSSTTLTNTDAIQKAINFASTNYGSDGATVEIPAGTYLSGPLTLQSHVNLQIDTNATLKMLPFVTYTNLFTTADFILGNTISDVEISGSGTIDGQGSPWWNAYNANNNLQRPNFIEFKKSHRILIQDVTMQNPPTFHMMLKNNNTDITIQRITINTPASPNTDGMDLGSSNVLVQNCYISDGDDNIEIGGSSALAANILVTNCTFGIGHGVSIGGYTQGCISNLTVVNCSFSNTDYGIRMKSDNDRGGIIQNLSYCSNRMINIKYAPIVIYSYYTSYGTPTTSKITPAVAAGMSVGSPTGCPIWRNILISNLWASAAQPGMIWGRTEMSATNIILMSLDITASGSYQNFEIYNAKQIQIVDSQFHLSASAYTNFWLFNADVTFTNSSASTSPISLYGITTSSYANSLAFYNSQANVSYTNLIGAGPLTLADSILTISNNFTMFPTTVLNYTLDSNTNRVAVVGNLALGGTNNLAGTCVFGAGTNTLLTYTGTLSGNLPTLGSTPSSSYTYAFDTNTAGQVKLVVTAKASPAPTTTSVQSSANPSTYGTVVTFTATVSPAPTNGESVTFKDGSTTLGTGTLSGGQATFNTTATQLAAGSHSITAVYAGDGALGASSACALTQTVNPLGLTVSGLTISNKVYNKTTAATLNTNGYTLNTVIGGDAVTLVTNGYTATFASSNVANNISVTVASLSLGGAQAANYTLTQPVGLTANITPLGLTVSGLTINNKVYDRTTAATLNTNGYALNTVIGGDVVTLATNGYTATFASSNVANNISVTITSLSLGGAQAGNYTLTQPAGLTANITPLGLTVSGLTINNKVYDGTAAAILNTNGYTLNTVIGGDAVMLVTNGYTATFANANVANNISVTVTNLSLGGAQAGNYTLTQPVGLTANITPLGLTVSGLTINNKVYNRTTAATLNTNGYVLNTVIGGDAVTLATNGYTATFASSNVANNISVMVASLSLGGAQAGNYTLTQPVGLTGNITPLGLTVSGLTINNKVYDRTTAATLNTNGYALNTVIGGDAVTLVTNGYTATFASSNVANNISVTVASLSLGGAQAGNYTLTQPVGLTGNITPLGLTVSGLTINNKVYNRTTAATLNTNGYALNTVIGGDVVTLATNGYTATFASSNVANNISVTVTNLSLGGAQAGNYTLTQPAGLTANITPLGLTVSGLTISNKVYDGTAAATLNTNGYALNTVIGGDVVTLVTNGYTAAFASSNVANGISVTVASLSLGGAQAGNYTLTQPTGLTANITPLGLTVSGLTISNKVYDGTAAATLNTNGYALNTVIGGDVVTLATNGYTATFVSSNVANGISVTVAGLSLGGAQAGNYTLTQPTGLTANITPADSSILLGSSANPVAHLSPVFFTASVTPSTLSGTVLFLTNGVTFDSQTLSGGTASSVTTSVLPRGTNTITAQYSGNANYSPSTNTLSEGVTNNPPTANPAVYIRLVGSPLTIVITNLATNWNDLDGDALALVGVSNPSTNGGTVTFDSANIYYNNGNYVTDRFGYTISDGQGGTNNGIVTVLMMQQTVSDVTVSNGSVVLDFTGIPGSTYWVEAATNLTPPMNWTPLSTNVAGTNGLWQFTDAQATNFLQRFYRTQLGQ